MYALLRVFSELDIGRLIVHLKNILWPTMPELLEEEKDAGRYNSSIDITSESQAPSPSDAVDHLFDLLHQAIGQCCERVQYARNVWVSLYCGC